MADVMVSRRRLIAGAATVALAARLPVSARVLGATPPPATLDARRVRLFAARNWASYYATPGGAAALRGLRRFDLADIDADRGNFDSPAQAAATVGRLREAGVLVVSYLNIGAAETFRWYWPEAKAFKLAPYAGWAGEYWMDVRREGWHDLLVERVAPALAATGIDGFFLDNIDVCSIYTGPAFRAGLVELVRRLRASFPSHLLIGQSYGMDVYLDRGLDGKRFYQYLDGTNKEEVNSTYEGGYHLIPRRESDRMLAELVEYDRRGLRVLTLDYAITAPSAAYCIRRSLAAGLLPFVSVRELDSLRVWDRTPPAAPANVRGARVQGGVRLSWQAADDDIGVSQYEVRRDGRRLGFVPGRGYVDDDAPPATATYQVAAWDTGRNRSAWASTTA